MLTESVKERLFDNYVEQPGPMETPCWIWQGAPNSAGRGRLHFDGKRVSVHRLALMVKLRRGILPDHQANHHCHVPMCMNPGHVYEGTVADNNWDRVEAGRHHGANKTHCKHGHEFTEENTYVSKAGKRQCKTCSVDRTRARRKRLKDAG